MMAKDLVNLEERMEKTENDRRAKFRFAIRRELRYKVLEHGVIVEAGAGESIDMSSGGVSFAIGHDLSPGAFIELSLSWPVLLGDSCPMRLVVFGRVVRNTDGKSACTIDKYEFRTQSRTFHAAGAVRHDAVFQRWAGNLRKEAPRARIAAM